MFANRSMKKTMPIGGNIICSPEWHNFIPIYSHETEGGGENTVRWCTKCGAITLVEKTGDGDYFQHHIKLPGE